MMTHTMEFIDTHDDGEEWLCLDCGRRTVGDHVIDKGDATVEHVDADEDNSDLPGPQWAY